MHVFDIKHSYKSYRRVNYVEGERIRFRCDCMRFTEFLRSTLNNSYKLVGFVSSFFLLELGDSVGGMVQWGSAFGSCVGSIPDLDS